MISDACHLSRYGNNPVSWVSNWNLVEYEFTVPLVGCHYHQSSHGWVWKGAVTGSLGGVVSCSVMHFGFPLSQMTIVWAYNGAACVVKRHNSVTPRIMVSSHEFWHQVRGSWWHYKMPQMRDSNLVRFLTRCCFSTYLWTSYFLCWLSSSSVFCQRNLWDVGCLL